LPGLTQRHTIIGRTGSGKTQMGAWALSHAPFDMQPFVIVDYKRDALLNACPFIPEIGLGDALPKHPGVYKVHPVAGQDEEVEAWLWRVHAQEHVGLYIDEGYMLPGGHIGSPAFRAILTQGRSKYIPVTVLTQRPSWFTRFAISEADFYTVFHLNSVVDKKIVGNFLPPGALRGNLPEYHSRWYDVARHRLLTIRPVPEADEIVDRLTERLKPKRRVI
jgi:DNA helicase HerA-like ATPase